MKLKSWMLTIVAGTIIMLMVWSKVAPNRVTPPIKMVPDGQEENKPRYYSEYWKSLASVANIWWETEEDLELPATGEAIQLRWDYVDLEPLRELIKSEGLTYSPEASKTQKGEVWVSEDKKTEVFYQPQTRKLEWVTNVEKPADLGTGTLPTKETAEEQIKGIIRNLSSTKTVTEVETKEISGKKLVYPRWVSADEEEADVWQISLNYVILDKNIVWGDGTTIEAIVGRGGKIVKLKMVWPLSAKEDNRAELNLKSLEEIKGELGLVRVWRVKGGEKTDLSYETSLSNIGASQIEMVYWWEAGEKWLMPYYIITGNGIASGEPVVVEMAMPAGKL